MPFSSLIYAFLSLHRALVLGVASTLHVLREFLVEDPKNTFGRTTLCIV
jgi:hypothetical protein